MQADSPYRLEFFGDEIDGIRIFDVDSQKSLENLDKVIIAPASDILLSSEDYKRARQKIQIAIEHSSIEDQQSYLREVLADMQAEYRHPDLRKFLSFLYENSWTLLDYLPKSSPLFLDDFHKIADKQAQFEKEVAMIKKKGVFDVVSGVLVGKPQDEEYYEEYKDILVKVVNDPDLPIVYNVNFGHATPRCVLQYGAMARVDMKRKIIKCEVM